VLKISILHSTALDLFLNAGAVMKLLRSVARVSCDSAYQSTFKEGMNRMMSTQFATGRSTCSFCCKPFSEDDPGQVVERHIYLLDSTSPVTDPAKPTCVAVQLAPDRVLCSACCATFGYTETQEPTTQLSCRHGPDFRSVRWFGTNFTFTAMQAACVGILWTAWENGTPEVGNHTLLVEAGAETKRIDHHFRDHPAWGTMIRPGKTKGTTRLCEPTEIL
jgi:hypothetical protein